MAKNKIVGSKSKGYYYVDKSGARVTANEIKMAVDFVMKNSNPASRQRNRLKQCFDALRKYPYVGKSDTPPELRNCRPMPGICLPDNVETAIIMG